MVIKRRKILCVDIGNTSISFAIVAGRSIRQHFQLSVCLSNKQLMAKIGKYAKGVIQKENCQEAMVCSVVPQKNKLIKTVLQRQGFLSVLFAGKDRRVPMKNNYKVPSQVGQDRLVGAYAAKELYGLPLIIIDFGTAITFDIVNKRGEYEGGIIVPGIKLSAETLFAKTALLPNIERMQKPRSIVGKNTKESILSGLFYGYGTMCSGLIAALKKKQGAKTKVIVTGGNTNLIKPYIQPKIDKIDPHLVFKGLYALYPHK